MISTEIYSIIVLCIDDDNARCLNNEDVLYLNMYDKSTNILNKMNIQQLFYPVRLAESAQQTLNIPVLEIGEGVGEGLGLSAAAT